MDWWLTLFLLGGAVLIIARLAVGPVKVRPMDDRPNEAASADEPEPWTPEAVARYGTETTVEDFARQGRAGELRGLGYDGDSTD